MRPVHFVHRVILASIFVACHAAIAQTTNEEIHLQVEVQHTNFLSSFSGTVIPILSDARYALTVRILSAIPANTNFATNSVVTFAIHSPALLLGGAGVPGRIYDFSLERVVENGRVTHPSLALWKEPANDARKSQNEENASRAFEVTDETGHKLPLFSLEAYRAEFRYLRSKFKEMDLHGPPIVTDGWTTNIPEAEWPVMTAAYLGYACADLAVLDPAMRGEYLEEMRWLLDALQTPRLSGFVKPHFGEPYSDKQIHVAVFPHGHFLNLATRYREVSGDYKYDQIIDRVASALTNSILTTDQGILRSYRDMWWITDNFPALAALARYDRVYMEDTTAARAKFLASLKEFYLEKRTGLFCTYIVPAGHVQSQGPRGISVMYGLHFLKDFDAPFAVEQYSLAKKFLIRDVLGVSAVREFPEGTEAKGDVDSGPVLFGLGPSASGFALGAAVVNGDTNTAQRLLNATALAGLPVLRNGELQYQSMPAVGQAVILFGKAELFKTANPPSTDLLLANLIAQRKEFGGVQPGRDRASNVVSLHLGPNAVHEGNLAMVSRLESLQELRIQAPSRYVTPQVAARISHMTNLTSLGLACAFNLQPGVVDEISKMRGLQSLTLYYARPPANEYASLTNLTALTSFRLVNCTNFTDLDLPLLTNLTKLTNLEITYSSLTRSATNVLGSLTNLTHLKIDFWK